MNAKWIKACSVLRSPATHMCFGSRCNEVPRETKQIQAIKREGCKCTQHGLARSDPYHMLSRSEQLAIFRLRTGHNRLNHHLITKFRDRPVRWYVPMPDLQYDRRASTAGVSTARHPQASVLAGWDYSARKLFGSLEDLRRTAAFVNRKPECPLCQFERSTRRRYKFCSLRTRRCWVFCLMRTRRWHIFGKHFTSQRKIEISQKDTIVIKLLGIQL